LLGLMDLSQPLYIEGLLSVVLVIVQANESGEEVVQFLLNLSRVDVCAVEHLSVAGWLGHVQTLHPC
jgi:hypothetical protein